MPRVYRRTLVNSMTGDFAQHHSRRAVAAIPTEERDTAANKQDNNSVVSWHNTPTTARRAIHLGILRQPSCSFCSILSAVLVRFTTSCFEYWFTVSSMNSDSRSVLYSN